MSTIGKDDIPKLMLKACPSFGPALAESRARYGDESMLYVHAGALARHLLALHRAGQSDEFPSVGAFIERLFAGGDPLVESFAQSGILWSLRTTWPPDPAGQHPFLRFLGPLSTQEWVGAVCPRVPVYDVADYFPEKIDAANGRHEAKLVSDLNSQLVGENSVLLPPEIVVRDFYYFHVGMGNGFVVNLDYCGGPGHFIRGLRAAKAMGAVEHAEIMEEVKLVIERHGLKFPDPLPEPWWDPYEGIGSELRKAIELHLGDLGGRYEGLDPHFSKGKHVYLTLLEYVYEHRNELACRKPSGHPPTLPQSLPKR